MRRIFLTPLLTFAVGWASGTAAETWPAVMDASPHDVTSLTVIEESVPSRPEPLRLKITHPRQDGPWPVILFSHGNFCEFGRYTRLVDHWVSHGYVVVEPQHLDAAPLTEDYPYTPAEVWRTRLLDMAHAIDVAAEGLESVAALAGQIDRTKISAAGHSYGALTALAMAGAKTTMRDGSGQLAQATDSRVLAVVGVSPPGIMPDFVGPDVTAAIDIPVFTTTGTEDSSAVMWPDWRAHRLAFDSATADNQYLAVVRGGDHYFGGLICTDRPNPPQEDALKHIVAATTAFFNAHVKGEPASQRFLAGADLSDLTDGAVWMERK